MEEKKKVNKDNVKIISETILIVAVLVAGAILLKGSKPPEQSTTTTISNTTSSIVPSQSLAGIVVDPVTSADNIIGNINAPVTVVEYADFQCPFCERFFNDAEKTITDKYVPTGQVSFVYRDYSILGTESTRAAEAARCAGDQGKYWEYHDYLFGHQNGENQGAFSDTNLKSFAVNLGLNTSVFNQCFDSNKYQQAVADSFASGNRAMPTASDRYTPKGFILKNGKLVDVILGAQPSSVVSAQIDAALK